MAKPVLHQKKKGGESPIASFMRILRGEKKKQSVEYEVIWIKRGRKARGKIIVNDKC